MGPIRQLLSPATGVAAAELFGTTSQWLPLADELHDVERATLGRAVDRRRADYAAARACARRALGELGRPPVAIVNRPDRSPMWPAGVVGSLTHTSGYCAAVVAADSTLVGVGIDAEPDEPLPRDVPERVLAATERDHLATLPAGDVAWDRLVFCIKEATYKVWFPLVGEWLGFEEADVRVEPGADTTAGSAYVRLLRDGLVVDGAERRDLTARWTSRQGYLGAVVSVTSSV